MPPSVNGADAWTTEDLGLGQTAQGQSGYGAHPAPRRPSGRCQTWPGE